jgi:hypothetical protein
MNGLSIKSGNTVFFRTAYNRWRDFKPYTDISGNMITVNDDIAAGYEWYDPINDYYISTEQLETLPDIAPEFITEIEVAKTREVENKPLSFWDKIIMQFQARTGIAHNTWLYQILSNGLSWIFILIGVFIIVFIYNLFKKRR